MALWIARSAANQKVAGSIPLSTRRETSLRSINTGTSLVSMCPGIDTAPGRYGARLLSYYWLAGNINPCAYGGVDGLAMSITIQIYPYGTALVISLALSI